MLLNVNDHMRHSPKSIHVNSARGTKKYSSDLTDTITVYNRCRGISCDARNFHLGDIAQGAWETKIPQDPTGGQQLPMGPGRSLSRGHEDKVPRS